MKLLKHIAVASALAASLVLPSEGALLRAHRAPAGDEPVAETVEEEKSEDPGLRGLDEEVTKLAARAETDKEAAAAEAKGLNEVAKLINNTLQPDILKEHDAAVLELKNLRDAFDKCKPAVGEGTPAGALFASGDKKDEEHEKCRKDEDEDWKDNKDCQEKLKSLKDSKDAACDAFEAVKREPGKAADDCHASPAQEYGDWLEANQKRFTEKLEEFRRLEKLCKEATEAYEAQVPICEAKESELENKKLECDEVQASFEDLSCSALTTAFAACKTADNCYERAVKAYEDRKPILQAEEKARKVNWRVFKRMLCLLEIIEKKGSHEDIEKCREKTHSTKHLDLDYFEVPPKPECEVDEPLTCSAAFLSGKYGALSVNTPAAECQACPGLDGGSAVPRWEMSMATGHEVCVEDTVFEYTKDFDCRGDDIIALGGKPSAGADGWRAAFEACARECKSRDDCTSFNYPTPGNGHCWIKRNHRNSPSRGWNCGGKAADDSHWQFFTKIPGASCKPPLPAGLAGTKFALNNVEMVKAGRFEKVNEGSAYNAFATQGNVKEIVFRAGQTSSHVRLGLTSSDSDNHNYNGGCYIGMFPSGRLYGSVGGKDHPNYNEETVLSAKVHGDEATFYRDGKQIQSCKVGFKSTFAKFWFYESKSAVEVEKVIMETEADANKDWCLKITTGTVKHADGYLTATVNGRQIADGKKKYKKGETVFNECIEKGGRGFDLLVQNTNKNAWIGSIQSSEDGGKTWAAMTCTECTRGTNTGENFGVDGDADKAWGEGDSARYTLCWKKKQCSVVPADKDRCQIDLYEHDNFGGWKASYLAGKYPHDAMVKGGAKNDKVSSIKVSGADDCQATLYQHGDYKGWNAKFGPGKYTLSKMKDKGAKNDAVSALKLE